MPKKFSTIVKGAFNGLLKFGLHTTVEAGVFLEMHSHFSGQELLSTTWEKINQLL